MWIAAGFAIVLSVFIAGSAGDKVSGGDGFVKNPSSVPVENRHPAFR